MKQTKLLLLLVTVLLASASAFASTRTLTGTVVDSQKEPVIGASIMLVKSSTGCMTDVDGTFTMKVPEGPVSLRISYVGCVTQTVKVAANQSKVNIIMQEDAQSLEETIVVGYGTQKKVNLTGAVAAIDGKTLEDRPSSSVSSMLQGSVSGLNVTVSSGVPGSSPELNIRGTASINGGSPLVLIDGSIGEINNVNPNDVQSISVIKDASAAAVYGARAAFGVILVTTKNGKNDGRATVRYNGRFGWQEPTTSTDYETRGYMSVYTINKFWQSGNNGNNYVNYDNDDMMALLERINDKTEHPDRPWVVEQTVGGKRVWKYYGNYDWYNTLFQKRHFQTQHNISLSGGSKSMKYFVSGSLDHNNGYLKINPDIYRKYTLRVKVDFDINKYANFSNNTSFYGSTYEFQGDGTVENTMAYSAEHGLPIFPMHNPGFYDSEGNLQDGGYVYNQPWTNYQVANGRHIIVSEGSHRNTKRWSDFTTTSRLNITPIKQLTVSADFTYRQYQTRNTFRSQPFYFRQTPDSPLESYAKGAGLDELQEAINTRHYYSVNAIATYQDTFRDSHNLKVMAGYNYETMNYKNVGAIGENFASTDLDDLELIVPDSEGQTKTTVSGGQRQYATQGIFGRINYDYEGKYLIELSGRYDGSSRFAKGNRWGFFPSGSLGWRFSEEKFFEPLQPWWSNGKVRFSYGTLGNQNVSSYYTFLRQISIKDFGAFSFGEGSTMAQYATLGAPIAGDLSWETAHQWDLGFDFGFFNNRLNATVDLYIRDTKNMLTEGITIPTVFGADPPDMNTADLRTKGYELSLNWNDSFNLFGHPFSYGIGFNISDYQAKITKYLSNGNKVLSEPYYEGKRLGEIWGFVTDGLFKTDEEAKQYTTQINHSYIGTSRLEGGWLAGDVKFVDRDGDGAIGIGKNTVDDHGDRVVLGNSLASLQYGVRANFNYVGIDFNIFFQGTGNHYWYPAARNGQFWGCYSYSYLSYMPKDFLDQCWSEDNPDAYFPRPRCYLSSGGYLKPAMLNDRYLQNLRYLRLKNLTVGYTLPNKWTRKAGIDKVRVYFSGENLCYWSPFHTKYIDPENGFRRNNDSTNAAEQMTYPWPKTIMFGLDLAF